MANDWLDHAHQNYKNSVPHDPPTFADVQNVRAAIGAILGYLEYLPASSQIRDKSLYEALRDEGLTEEKAWAIHDIVQNEKRQSSPASSPTTASPMKDSLSDAESYRDEVDRVFQENTKPYKMASTTAPTPQGHTYTPNSKGACVSCGLYELAPVHQMAYTIQPIPPSPPLAQDATMSGPAEQGSECVHEIWQAVGMNPNQELLTWCRSCGALKSQGRILVPAAPTTN